MKCLLTAVLIVLGTCVLTAPVDQVYDPCTKTVCWEYLWKFGKCEDLVNTSSNYYWERVDICNNAAPNYCTKTCDAILEEEKSNNDKDTAEEAEKDKETPADDNKESPNDSTSDTGDSSAVTQELPNDNCTSHCWNYVGMSGSCKDLEEEVKLSFEDAVDICNGQFAEGCPETCKSILEKNLKEGNPSNDPTTDTDDTSANTQKPSKDNCTRECWHYVGMSGTCKDLEEGAKLSAVDICNGQFAEGCPETCKSILEKDRLLKQSTTGHTTQSGENTIKYDESPGSSSSEDGGVIVLPKDCKDSEFLYGEEAYACFKLTQQQSRDIYRDRRTLCLNDKIRTSCCKSCKFVDNDKMDFPDGENTVNKADDSVKTSQQVDTALSINFFMTNLQNLRKIFESIFSRYE